MKTKTFTFLFLFFLMLAAALPGSSLTIRNGSRVLLRPGGECSVEAGAVGDISYGSVELP